MIRYADFEPSKQPEVIIGGKRVPFDANAARRLALNAMLLATKPRA